MIEEIALSPVGEKAEKLLTGYIRQLLREKRNGRSFGEVTVTVTFKNGEPGIAKFSDNVTHKFDG